MHEYLCVDEVSHGFRSRIFGSFSNWLSCSVIYRCDNPFVVTRGRG
jgi:hypothetical protein